MPWDNQQDSENPGSGKGNFMLTRETFVGPWAGLPVAWTEKDQFDEDTYRSDVDRCCRAGIPGVYTGGTTGEFYAMELEEFRAVAKATVEQCSAHGVPCMIGCTSTHTLGVLRRASYAVGIGADAIQVALPFWLEMGDDLVVPFFREVASATGGVAISIYETLRAKKALTVDQHRAIKDVAPSYLMVKSNADTVGATPEGCRTLAEFVNVFVGENKLASLGPLGARGSCSSVVYWNPKVVLGMWEELKSNQWDALTASCRKLTDLIDFLLAEFGPRGFTDSAFDRLGGVAGGFLKTSLRCRRPYPHATPDDVAKLRAWYRRNFKEMLDL